MKFGAVPVGEAEGGVAVHSIRQSGLVLKKGTLIGKAEIAALKSAGIAEIVVARYIQTSSTRANSSFRPPPKEGRHDDGCRTDSAPASPAGC